MTNYYDFVKANPALFKQFSYKEALFLIVDCPPEFVKAEDWINHNCFLHVISGSHILFSRERSWLVSKGATVFIKKGGLGIQRVDEHAFCALMFYVPDSYIHSFINDKTGLLSRCDPSLASKDLLVNVETNDVLVAFFNSVMSYFNTGQQPPEELLELKFKELLLNIVSNPANNELTAYLHKVYLTGDNDLKDIMERNYVYNLSLDEYARISHRSLSKFKRDFYAVFGMPPGKWLLEKRLEYAGRLLMNSKKSITDVVLESGFTNTAHFDRVFKKCFGESPLQYRKKLLGTPAYS
ncbi:MAG TPA: AraC family transcriptional regulator [Chitinophagaceae bacterium]|nr:AraC family transcriptional regulator [Chitinophagaceae bacterium]